MSDEAFLDFLLAHILDRSPEPIPDERWLSPEWITAVATRRVQVWQGINRVARGQPSEGPVDATLVEEVAESIHQQGYGFRTELRGARVQFLRNRALKMTGTHAQKLSGIPVGRVPLRNAKAAAIRSPSGGAVVLLNGGLELQLEYFITCWEAMRTRCPPAPTEIPSREAQEALVGIGMIVSDAEIVPAERQEKTPFLYSLLAGKNDAYFSSLLHVNHAEIFVLLHEYGHIVLGHHATCEVSELHLGRDVSVQQFNYSQECEFAADEFACDALSKAFGGDPTKLIIYTVGISFLFMYFELRDIWKSVDYSSEGRTHPPPAERWARICELLKVDHPDWSLAELMTVHMPYLKYYVAYHRDEFRAEGGLC